MRIRPYQQDDLKTLIKLFRSTVHEVNRRDYSRRQVTAWAPDDIDRQAWAERLAVNHCLIAQSGDDITGFAEITGSGHLQMIFVHPAYLRRGIAGALLAALEGHARQKGVTQITSEVSITARPFFDIQGYHVEKEQQVEIRGETLTNYRMVKTL